MSAELVLAARQLIAAAMKAKRRLAGTNIMGQKLDKPLCHEIDEAIAKAERALDEHEQQAMKDEQRRQEIRRLALDLRDTVAKGIG